MTTVPDLRGVWVPLITPFDSSGAVDIEAIGRLCHEYLDAGAVGIVALGTTGESPALDATEKQAVIAACSDVCAARGAQLMVGTGTNSTRTTVAANAGLGAVAACTSALVVVPYYVRPSEASIVEHFKTVAAASPVPIVIYNIPYRTGRGLGARSVLELASVPNIVGIKQAVGALDADTLEILRDAPSDFFVLCGDDAYILPIILMGGHGTIAAAAHVCTEQFVAMVECGLQGKLDDARKYSHALLGVVQTGFDEPNPAVWKGVLHAQGRIATPDLRAPMGNASADAITACLAAITTATR